MRILQVYIGEHVLIGEVQQTEAGFLANLLVSVDTDKCIKDKVFGSITACATAISKLFPISMQGAVHFWEFDGQDSYEFEI